jgi:hypothetical protein
MKKSIVSLMATATGTLLLGGCGLEVGASAAAQGGTAVQQVEEGKKTQEQVEQRIEDAQAEAAKLREQAETIGE